MEPVASEDSPGPVLVAVGGAHTRGSSSSTPTDATFCADSISTPKRSAWLSQPVGELAAADALGEAGEVVEALSDAGLAADAAALDDQRVDALARGVQRRGEPRGAAADDDQIVEALAGRCLQAQLGGELGVGRLDQHGAVAEEDGRDDVAGRCWPLRRCACPSALASMSMNSYGTRCSPKNCLARLQSEHHRVPYMRIVMTGGSYGSRVKGIAARMHYARNADELMSRASID